MGALVIVLVGVCIPAAALGQEVFGALDFEDVWSVPAIPTVNLEICEENTPIVVGWRLDATPTAEQRVTITTNERDTCAEASETSVVADRTAATGDQTAEVTAQSILPECPAVDDDVRYICLTLAPVLTDEAGVTVAVPVAVDTIPPDPPDELGLTPADSALIVRWEWLEARPGDLAEVRVLHRPEDDDGAPSRSTVSGATISQTRITGLQNGVSYEVWVQAVDEAGNVGDESEPQIAAPQPTVGFWDTYRERGGSEVGGCSAAPGTSLPVALLLVAALVVAAGAHRARTPVRAPSRGRRRTGKRGGMGSAGLLLVPMLAGAGMSIPGQAEAGQRAERDRGWFLEVDLGPYRPEIDSEFDDDGPYGEAFGEGTELLPRLRAERSLWSGFGQLAAGLSVGFAQAAGRAVFEDGSPSPDSTVFNWVPLQLSATYRLDYTAIEWGVPFVPYARAGLASTIWWIRGPNGVEVDEDGNRAVGMRHGWFYGGGLKLLLNSLDPRLAADFRRGSGVRRTYLYGDVTRMEIDGFGTDGFVFSDTTWFVGLSVEL